MTPDRVHLILPLLVILMLPVMGMGGLSFRGHDRAAVALPDCDPDNGGITLPPGFCATVFADSLGRLRHIVVNEAGTVYVMRPRSDEGGVLALRDADGDGRADEMQGFSHLHGTGAELYEGYLYVATDTSVHRYALGDELVPGSDPELIVGGFPDQPSHAAKTIAFDDAGNLYVNVGAPSNACQVQARTQGSPGQDPCTQLDRQAGIWRFDAETPGQTQEGDGHRFSTGIRNGMALAWHPAARRVYTAQHGRDQLHHLWGDLYTEEQNAELPAEELFQLYDGADFGWPACYYDHERGMKVLAPEYGGDGTEAGLCADKEDPIVAFPGHYAPNDMIFYAGSTFPGRYRGGALIAFHGSWNRAPLPQEGYNVTFVPMDEDGQPTGEWEVFADGFKGTDSLASPGDARYRPSGLAMGSDGAVYVTDSMQGRIWRITYTGIE